MLTFLAFAANLIPIMPKTMATNHPNGPIADRYTTTVLDVVTPSPVPPAVTVPATKINLTQSR